MSADADEARELLRAARTGTLATLLPDGAPYASLVTLAAGADGAPLFLLSRLALHTRNLARDPRASLLLRSEAGPGEDALAGTRVSLIGRIAASADEPGDREHFLAAHPEAAAYAGFADFSLYAMTVERAHLIAGFGRIVDIPGTELAGRRPPAAPADR